MYKYAVRQAAGLWAQPPLLHSPDPAECLQHMLYSGLLLPAPHQGFNDRPCCICQTPQDACSTCSALAGTNLSNHPLPWLHLQAPQNARTTPRNHPPHLLRLPDLQQIGIACSASIVPGKFAESAAVTSKYDVAQLTLRCCGELTCNVPVLW